LQSTGLNEQEMRIARSMVKQRETFNEFDQIVL